MVPKTKGEPASPRAGKVLLKKACRVLRMQTRLPLEQVPALRKAAGP